MVPVYESPGFSVMLPLLLPLAESPINSALESRMPVAERNAASVQWPTAGAFPWLETVYVMVTDPPATAVGGTVTESTCRSDGGGSSISIGTTLDVALLDSLLSIATPCGSGVGISVSTKM